MTAVPLRDAARALGKSEATLRRWVGRGCPVAVLGGPGRGKGSRVCVADLQRWRASQRAVGISLEDLERFLVDYHRAGDHRLVGLHDEPARLLYAALYEYIEGRLETAQSD
jgi:hypothetical protein